ncbi:hypothetical protein [Pseudomonas batumici]|uniref:Uncharacterized protein n=1 Tax=Pseudomonas batumici TaxID=226910 RepID=A0A0C2EE86_9PSED|nr:hypothetical protein [Pseudomonas batumici]KIH84289.1 hypothetical protein UCMB321_1858 [Pseudomonas batumici]
MTRIYKTVIALNIVLAILASLTTIAVALSTPPPSTSLTLPLIVLQCYR